jgi:hypothetical protein
MATKKQKKQTTVAIAATTEDLKLLQAFRSKLGLNNAGVIRLSLRKLAEQENVQVA